MKPSRRPLWAAGSISLATGISRVLGLLREQVMAYFFGAGIVTDAFLAAFRISNVLRDLFAEGALSSAFVPTFTREREQRGDEPAWRLANRIFSLQFVIVGSITVLIALGAPWVVRLFAPGFEGAKLQLAVTMTRIVAPFLLFVGLAAVAMGVLNTYGRFFVPALAPASFNVSSILTVVLLYPVLRGAGVEPGLTLAFGALLGGFLQFGVQLPAMRKVGFRFRFDPVIDDPAVRRVGRLMLPAVFGLAATQVNILVDTILASRMGDAPISWLAYAFRLMMLPLGLFGVALATANLAVVSRDAARGDLEALRANLASTLRAAALLTLPATAGLIALREPIVRVIFQHGRFDATDTAQTASAVLCYGLGLYAYSVTKIQAPTFYALGDTRTPVIASASAVGAKIGANFLLIWLLARAGVEPFLALALSTSLAAWINFALLSRGLRRAIGSLAVERVLATSLKVALLSAAMGAACAASHRGLERVAGGGGFGGEVGRLAAAIALGVAITGLGAWVLRIPEARAVAARIGRGLGR